MITLKVLSLAEASLVIQAGIAEPPKLPLPAQSLLLMRAAS